MSRIEVDRYIDSPPERVWEVLSDGWSYVTWVVGASRIRAVNPGWPAVGTELHHSFGTWPAVISDSTRVLTSEPSRRLVLRARGWPMGEATVDLRLEPEDGGTRVRLFEDVAAGPPLVVPSRLRQLMIKPRNVEALRRLAWLCEQHAEA